MKKRWSIIVGSLGLVLFSFACGGPDELHAESLEQAATVTLRGTVTTPDTACNATVSPTDFTIAPGETAVVAVSVPTGWEIRDWRCTGDTCTKTFVGVGSGYEERLELRRAGDAAHASGALIGILPSPSAQKTVQTRCWYEFVHGILRQRCRDVLAPACCTCPCDFNPGCQ